MFKLNLEQKGEKFLPQKLKSHAQPMLRMADAILSGDDENSASQRIALTTFCIRVLSAFIALISQILLARWLGTFEYGIYVAVWVALVILSSIVCIGFPSAVVRFIGEYRERGQPDLMHGIIRASMYISLLFSSLIALVGCAILYNFPGIISDYYIIPIFLAAICLPILGAEAVMDCVARAFNWPKVAFVSAIYYTANSNSNVRWRCHSLWLSSIMQRPQCGQLLLGYSSHL